MMAPVNTPNEGQIEDFDSFDHLSLKQFANRLLNFIESEKRFVEGSLVLSLNAPFGTGKSTFLRMWQRELESCRQQDQSIPIVTMLNAWETDYAGDPILALLDGISEILEKHKTYSQNAADNKKLKEAVKDVANFTIAAANSFVSTATGVDLIQAGEYANSRKEKGQHDIDVLRFFQAKRKALSKLKSSLSDCFSNRGKSVIFLVDELDRCRPDYAVDYLEAIKHLFGAKGLTFVLAVDLKQLECSSKALFGADLNFREYYRKFVHRNIQMPEIQRNGRERIVLNYIERYIGYNSTDSSIAIRRSSIENPAQQLVDLVSSFKMTLRQIQEMFRIIGHTAECTEEGQGTLRFYPSASLMLMSAIFVANSDVFHRIMSERFDYSHAKESLGFLLFHSKGRRNWRQILLSGLRSFEKKGSWRAAAEEAKRLELYPEDDSIEQIEENLKLYTNEVYDWSRPHLIKAGQRIVELVSFASE